MPYRDYPETIPNGRKHGKSLNLSPNGRVGNNYTSTIPDALISTYRRLSLFEMSSPLSLLSLKNLSLTVTFFFARKTFI